MKQVAFLKALCFISTITLIGSFNTHANTELGSDIAQKQAIVDQLFDLVEDNNDANELILQYELKEAKKLSHSGFTTDDIPQEYQVYVEEYLAKQTARIAAERKQRLDGEMKTAIKRQYAAYYTLDELQQILAFNQSPLGQKRLSFQIDMPVADEISKSARLESFNESMTKSKEIKQDFILELEKAGFDTQNLSKYRNTPMQAIQYSEASPEKGYEGVFEFEVQNAAMVRGRLILNSERDYRDRRNVSVKFHPELLVLMQSQHGLDLESYFKGKTITVKGTANRAVIKAKDSDGKILFPYYQTHINVSDLAQLVLVK